jgi:hypothetical protein
VVGHLPRSNATSVNGNGGAGTASSISGISTPYAGGGGGGRYTGSDVGGDGGVGGGGNARFTPTAGTANTGGGGGGLTLAAVGQLTAAAGGSGIVILKYRVPVGTTVTHIYKGSGSWVAPDRGDCCGLPSGCGWRW